MFKAEVGIEPPILQSINQDIDTSWATAASFIYYLRSMHFALVVSAQSPMYFQKDLITYLLHWHECIVSDDVEEDGESEIKTEHE